MPEFYDRRTNKNVTLPTQTTMVIKKTGDKHLFDSHHALVKSPEGQKALKDAGRGVITRKVIAPAIAKVTDKISKVAHKLDRDK